MKIKVKKYDPPREVTYTTIEVFLAVDEETKVGLRVVGTQAEFVGWNTQTHQYDREGYRMQTHRGINIDGIQGLLAAYESRDL